MTDKVVVPDANILILVCQVQVTVKIERLDSSCRAPEMILRTAIRRQIVRCTANLSHRAMKLFFSTSKIKGKIKAVQLGLGVNFFRVS